MDSRRTLDSNIYWTGEFTPLKVNVPPIRRILLSSTSNSWGVYISDDRLTSDRIGKVTSKTIKSVQDCAVRLILV